MNVLAMGINLWQDNAQLRQYRSRRGHQVRTIGIIGEDTDLHFEPFETAEDVVRRVSRAWPVDLLLCGCPEMYPPPRQIERCPCRTAAMISDWNLYQPQLEHNLCRFDTVLSDKLGTQQLKIYACRARYWGPVYAQRSAIHRDFGLTRDIDIGFYGNRSAAAHPRRARLLERLDTVSDRYRIEISGGHDQEAYAHLLNRTRIAFNVTLRREMNLRCFEAPACGALLFVEEDNLECHDHFIDGESAVFYSDDNLLARAAYYLEHEEERQAIARRGKTIIDAMAAEHRLDDLFEFIVAARERRGGFDDLTDRERLRAGAIWYGSARPAPQQLYARSAIDCYLEAAPNDPSALLMHGCHCLDAAAWVSGEDKRRQLQTALGSFQAATHNETGGATAWYNLGIVLKMIGARRQAEAALEQARQCDTPGDAAALLGKHTDPNYVRLRWKLAIGAPVLPDIHAMASEQLAPE